MAELLSTLSIISFIAAGVCFAFSVFFWIFFRIPTIIGDLSGRTAKKSIEKMRTANEKSGTKSYKESRINAERGKITDSMKRSKNLIGIQNNFNERPDTGLLNENYAGQNLKEAKDILNSDTTGLLVDKEETDSLNNLKADITIKLNEKTKMQILDEIILIHTEEVIR